jgi:hypothetical protein
VRLNDNGRCILPVQEAALSVAPEHPLNDDGCIKAQAHLVQLPSCQETAGEGLDEDCCFVPAEEATATELASRPVLYAEHAPHDAAVQSVIQEQLLRLPQKHLQPIAQHAPSSAQPSPNLGVAYLEVITL